MLAKELNDKEILTHLKRGDTAALDTIYRQYNKTIYRFALSWVKDEDDAYDIVQNVFIKLWDVRLDLNDDTLFNSFLFVLARSIMLSTFRKKATNQKYIDYLYFCSSTGKTSGNTTDDEVDYNSLKEQFNRLVDQLPEKRKEIFILNREKELSYREIAELKGISERTVEDHIRKALKFIRPRIDRDAIISFLFISQFLER